MPLSFLCEICSAEFNTEKSLTRHRNRSHQNACTLCRPSRSFKSWTAWNLHTRKVHTPPAAKVDSVDCRVGLLPGELYSENISNANECNSELIPTAGTEERRGKSINTFREVSVSGETGSCMYLAAIQSLRHVGYPRHLTVELVRQMVHDELLAHRDVYTPFLLPNENGIERYAERVLLHDQWGDEISLQALSRSLDIHVTVYKHGANQEMLYTTGDENSPHHIYLALDAFAEHYSALIQDEEHNALDTDETDRGVVGQTNDITCDSEGIVGEKTTPTSRLNKTDNSVHRFSSAASTEEMCIDDEWSSVQLDEETVRRTSRRVNTETEEVRSSVKSNGSKQVCPNCHRAFVNLSRHRKCPMTRGKQNNAANNSTGAAQPFEETDIHERLSGVNNSNASQNDQSATNSANIRQESGQRGTTEKPRLGFDRQQKLNQLRKDYNCLPDDEITSNDSLYLLLKESHDAILLETNDFNISRITREIESVVDNLALLGDEDRPYVFSDEDQKRLTHLTAQAQNLKVPPWPWSDENREYIQARLNFLVQEELVYKIIECPQCQVTSILVGMDQIHSTLCIDCIELNKRKPDTVAKFMTEWNKVKPDSKFPQYTDSSGKNIGRNLPKLSPAERSVISVCHSAVTIIRTGSTNNVKYRQECINLLRSPETTWCKILPRRDLKDRFVIIERSIETSKTKRYMVARLENVRSWLNFLFQNHNEYVKLKQYCQLEFSEDALRSLGNGGELADVIEVDDESGLDKNSHEPVSSSTATELHSGLRTDVFVIDDKRLYVDKQTAMKMKAHGKIQILKESSPSKSTDGFQVSANVCFPDLFQKGQPAPTDCRDSVLGHFLLKKISLFAQKLTDGKKVWLHSENGIYLMREMARLNEQHIRKLIGWYVSERPETLSVTLDSILDAFRQSLDSNFEGIIDSRLPMLHSLMCQIPNSRESWFSERLSVEAISRDFGDATIFLTLNCDPRSWIDCRKLLFDLEHQNDAIEFDPQYFERNGEVFADLLDKHSALASIYLFKRGELFIEAFLNDICRVTKHTQKPNSGVDRLNSSWSFARVEWTETRSIIHFHVIAKLPYVLNTSVLGKLVHNARTVRTELKCGNVRRECVDRAWKIIEVGLLATRYLCLLSDSLTTAAFFRKTVSSDEFDPSNVVDLDSLRKEFVTNYASGNINTKTHPLMRQFTDDCENREVEVAEIASISSVHECLAGFCGGQENSGCRFSFPKVLLKKTIVTELLVNREQVEVHVLPRRTHPRVCNVNPSLLLYWRGNMMMDLLCSFAHKIRYVCKYICKTGAVHSLLNQMLDVLSNKRNDLVAPSVKQTLSNLLLADSSHKTLMGKLELAHKVLELPQVIRSYQNLTIVSWYPRCSVYEKACDGSGITIELSDRTAFSAYSERLRESTVCTGQLTKEKLVEMCFRTFAEQVNFTWVLSRNTAQEDNPVEAGMTAHTRSRSFRLKSRDVKSGYWKMSLKSQCLKIRFSKVVYSPPTHEYLPIEVEDTSSQMEFYALEYDKQRQLLRSYYELVCYVPWHGDADECFLDEELREKMRDESFDPESKSRYSRIRLEGYHRKYMELWKKGLTANTDDWRIDNQFSLSMYLANKHNRSVYDSRRANDGMFDLTYEKCPELENTSLKIRIDEESEWSDMKHPSASNFLPASVYAEIQNQIPLSREEIHIAYPSQHTWQEKEDMMKRNSDGLFMASPPEPMVSYDQLTDVQKCVFNTIVEGRESVYYVYGRAGSGKSSLALLLCKAFRGRVQVMAPTALAASIFNAPTIHGAFRWNINANDDFQTTNSRKIEELKSFYSETTTFLIDECNTLSACLLGQIDQIMQSMYGSSEVFAGKKVILFGDAGQLRPVCGDAIYDDKVTVPGNCWKRKSARFQQRESKSRRGQEIYRQYMMKNCFWLERSQRTSGLLTEITNKLRDGKQEESDLDKLLLNRNKHRGFLTERGLHYSNESAALLNCEQLWTACNSQSPAKRIHVCRATYFMNGENDQVVSALSSIPASKYQFAQDLLTVAEGCVVRLICNLSVQAGLCTNSIGKVVRVIYDHRDIKSLCNGEFPSPYAIVVSFGGFKGFPSTASGQSETQRRFPFADKKLVPLYRRKFYPESVPLPVRKLQASGHYRFQFPIDLSSHLTVHRSQGQTFEGNLSVKLDLESPDNVMPHDTASLIYVACTRVRKLENLFVDGIYPTTWMSIGQREFDEKRRNHEKELKECAGRFARANGFYCEFETEVSHQPDFSGNKDEWNALLHRPTPRPVNLLADVRDAVTSLDNEQIPFSLKAVARERIVGIDQGMRHFAIVAVDCFESEFPTVVGSELYDLLELGLTNKTRLRVSDLVLLLEQKTVLFNWLQQPSKNRTLKEVDRVTVLVEMMSPWHRNAKLFSSQLANYLQGMFDLQFCVVKLSHPHNHGKTGPLFQLGKDIVNDCDLVPMSESYMSSVGRKRWAGQVTETELQASGRHAMEEQTENGIDDDHESETSHLSDQQLLRRHYRKKKEMSASVFRYFMNADERQMLNMQVRVEKSVQECMKTRTDIPKFDDLGDALLHCLKAILCNSTSFRQVGPQAITSNANRTVVLFFLPQHVYWVAMKCTWNSFLLEEFGKMDVNLEGMKFKNEGTVSHIQTVLSRIAAMNEFGIGSDHNCSETNYIRVVVKQLKANQEKGLDAKSAGSLTNSVVLAVTKLSDMLLADAEVYSSKSKQNGWTYARRCKKSGRRFQVTRSASKHLQAVLSCMQFFRDYLPEFMSKRRLRLNTESLGVFFAGLQAAACSDGDENNCKRLEAIELSSFVENQLTDSSFSVPPASLIMADLTLIALNSNQQYVGAIAENYRSSRWQQNRVRLIPRKMETKSSVNSNKNGQVLEADTQQRMEIDSDSTESYCDIFPDVEPE